MPIMKAAAIPDQSCVPLNAMRHEMPKQWYRLLTSRSETVRNVSFGSRRASPMAMNSATQMTASTTHAG